MTTQPVTARTPEASRLIAAEVRAEMGRQGLSKAQLARVMHVSEVWIGRRLVPHSTVPITFEEADAFAEALGVPVAGLLSSWLHDELRARRDSNPKPSDP